MESNLLHFTCLIKTSTMTAGPHPGRRVRFALPVANCVQTTEAFRCRDANLGGGIGN